MVVEDDPGLMALYEILLNGEGYSVIGAEDGEDALRVFDRVRMDIDLLIADLFLPRMCALEMLTRMRASGPMPRVLICSGAIEPEMEIRMRELGADGFLAKPFRNHQILGAIERMLVPIAEAA